mmetsp:Transcript_29125/g.93898  ORF Transcript_29125/g.93898 Transcript_29125/m.93898 type:complete len:126 (+) Transcript_29125:1142-1519(+)
MFISRARAPPAPRFRSQAAPNGMRDGGLRPLRLELRPLARVPDGLPPTSAIPGGREGLGESVSLPLMSPKLADVRMGGGRKPRGRAGSSDASDELARRWNFFGDDRGESCDGVRLSGLSGLLLAI